MSKDTLYLKYRPSQLDDVVGQKHTTSTLKQASIANKFVHAYLFSGNKGCGKTTTARILANLLTCEDPKDGKVCGKCRACKTIHEGVAMDVIELDGAANGNVENVQSLIEGANWHPSELKRKVYILDECLGRLSRINTEHGLMRVDDIVRNKKKINVFSYNEKTKKIELKPIIGWFKNSGKIIKNIKFESEGVLYASDNHLVATPNGYVKVRDLNKGDYVIRKGTQLTYDQKQLIYGSMLGDASVSKNKPRKLKPRYTNARLRFVHGCKQKKYLEEKYKILSGFCRTPPKKYRHNGFKGYPEIETWRFNTTCSSQLTEVYNKTTLNGRKKINTNWLKEIDWQGMAFWFCDDGSVQRYKNKNKDGFLVAFNTQGFSFKENYILKKWLEKKGLECSIFPENNNGNKQYRLILNKKSSICFLKRIYDYVPDCIKFKLKGFYSDNSYKTQDLHERKYEENNTDVIYEKIKEISPIGFETTTYDIEVGDNHNYFVSGTLVHNCHQLTGRAISALLKIVEEPPEYLVFIFCTTEPKKIPSTILSRSQRFNFRKISSKEIVGRLGYIAKEENIPITEGALFEIAKLSRGCLRDAIVPLEQIATIAAKKEINEVSVQKYFGLPDRQGILKIISAMVEENIPLVLDQVNDMIVASADIEAIAYEITEAFRSIMILKAQNGQTKLIDLPDHEIVQLNKIGESVKMGQLDRLAHLFSTIKKELEFSINERWILESTLIHGIALLRKT